MLWVKIICTIDVFLSILSNIFIATDQEGSPILLVFIILKSYIHSR